MGKNLVEKILQAHIVEGCVTEAGEVAIRIDNTLTQDSTGTLAYLQFESMGVEKVKTDLSLSFVDHNTLQTGFENADDHAYLQSVAAKYGVKFSRPGNGICHQVFLERFACPGKTLLGSDSHTPTAGGMGMLAIGAGGLDVAVAMAGLPYNIPSPKVCKIELRGILNAFASAKDIILEVLKRLTVKGGVGWIFEYAGEGVATLSIPERATITNMGAELGATTSIFPSDVSTKEFLEMQGRLDCWVPLGPDNDAKYDNVIAINLNELVPMVAKPHSPDNVVAVRDIKGLKVNQVLIGSCTNGSLADMMKVAQILDGKTVHPGVSLGISPGSKQVLTMLAENGALAKLVKAGARIQECACGACIGMGQAPASGAISLRTFNRNFPGRSGTKDADIYLVSPEVAAVSAINGFLSDPSDGGLAINAPVIEKFFVEDNMIIDPPADGTEVKVVRGRNIIALKPFPRLEDELAGKVLIKAGDNISTDGIMPSNAKLLPYRSNIPYLSEHCLAPVDAEFPTRAKANNGGFIIAGDNYGQGSSREHAAIVPRYLGVKAVVAKSFARIHKANLINMGIVPLVFKDANDYEEIDILDDVQIKDFRKALRAGSTKFAAEIGGRGVILCGEFTKRQTDVLLCGGLLNLVKEGDACNA